MDDGDPLAGEATPFLQSRERAVAPGALGDVVRVAEQDPHRAADLRFRDGDNPRRRDG
ncbi:MAG: hypothetical protein WA709_02250 [Stellaceae bacterium]